MRILTKDYHPKDHISFASSHPGPDNQPFSSFVTMNNPAPGKESESKSQQLWPVHCVANTAGAEIIPEIDSSNVDLVVRKGMRPEVEMYSVFADAFGNCDPGTNAHSVSLDVAAALRAQGVTDVVVVGLAGDYCVKATAIDAARVGFKSWVVEEGTKCVVPAVWEDIKRELEGSGVSVISKDDPLIERLGEKS
jgi:nicotinamidase-related amidase